MQINHVRPQVKLRVQTTRKNVMTNEYKLKHIYMVYCGLNKVKYKPEHRVTNTNQNIQNVLRFLLKKFYIGNVLNIPKKKSIDPDPLRHLQLQTPLI